MTSNSNADSPNIGLEKQGVEEGTSITPTTDNDASAAANDTATITTAAGGDNGGWTRDELIELVKAIKFAKPDYSQRQVHREITEELSQRDSFEFLKDVPFNEVKKVWKKAMQQNNTASANSSSSTPTTSSQAAASATSTSNPNADLIDKIKTGGSAPQLFTVGDGSVKFLAQEYTAATVAAEQAKAMEEQALADDIRLNYVHFFLNVPADKSGSRPHQALISFNKPNQNVGSKSANNKGKKGKGKKGSKASSTNAVTATSTTGSATGTDDNDGLMIVKIQMAAPLHENDTAKHVMLAYNIDKTSKTFIHYDPNDEYNGYDRIQEMIQKDGVGGALGIAGGTKAYFFARVTIPTKKKGGAESILSIKMTELAPPQNW